MGAQWGYYTDPETGLVLMGHRYYDPGTGRFINRDPSGYSGGVNLYAFADNNPVNESDPSGLDPGDDPVDRAIDNGLTITGAGIGAVGGGTIGGAGGTLVLPVGGTIAGAVGMGAAGAAGGALLGHTAARLLILARHLIMNASGPGAGDGIETGPEPWKKQLPGRYNGRKPEYDNPGHHDEESGNFRGGGDRTTSLPSDAEDAYQHAVPDETGNNWYARGKDGDIYRYQQSNGVAHWNGREWSARGLSVPRSIRGRLGPTPKPPRGFW